MKSYFSKGLFALLFAVSLVAFSSPAAAYYCQWHNGQKVCYSHHRQHCRWVHSHWKNGYRVPSHQVCWN